MAAPPDGNPSAGLDAELNAPLTRSARMNQVDIKAEVPVVLGLEEENYDEWQNSMLAVLNRFEATGHVNGEEDEPAQEDGGDDVVGANEAEEWRRADMAIVMWIFRTVSSQLVDIIAQPGLTAYDAWSELAQILTPDKPARAIYLKAEFRSTTQGDMTVLQYWRRLKALVDALAGVDVAIADDTLTLHIIRGASERYRVMVSMLLAQFPLMSSIGAQSYLMMKNTRSTIPRLKLCQSDVHLLAKK